MTRLRSILTLGLISLAASAGCAAPEGGDTVVEVQGKVVYGTDDRRDPFAYADQVWAARAVEFTAALVPTSQIDATDPNNINIGNRTLTERLNVCPDERFATQPANADCSATLIAPDIMLTAGHCINNCGDSRFVFDYRVTAGGTLPPITQDDVYACSSFLAFFQSSTGLDYAIVRLTRPVVGRQPAAVRTARTALPVGTPLIVSGHPSGLPLKIADNAAVRSNSPNLDWFVANLDTFIGNSGSGVFDANTKELVGILVRGAQDYVPDGTCNRVNVCPNDGCRGEDVIYSYRAIDDMCEETSSPLCPSPAVTATFNLSSQSATQYCGDILVRNNLASVISSWRVDVDLRQSTLLNNWNSVFTAQGGSRYAVTPQPWNRFIQPGQSVAAGMCASKTGPNFLPQILSATGS
jgi:hypothetical protein